MKKLIVLTIAIAATRALLFADMCSDLTLSYQQKLAVLTAQYQAALLGTTDPVLAAAITASYTQQKDSLMWEETTVLANAECTTTVSGGTPPPTTTPTPTPTPTPVTNPGPGTGGGDDHHTECDEIRRQATDDLSKCSTDRGNSARAHRLNDVWKREWREHNCGPYGQLRRDFGGDPDHDRDHGHR